MKTGISFFIYALLLTLVVGKLCSKNSDCRGLLHQKTCRPITKKANALKKCMPLAQTGQLCDDSLDCMKGRDVCLGKECYGASRSHTPLKGLKKIGQICQSSKECNKHGVCRKYSPTSLKKCRPKGKKGAFCIVNYHCHGSCVNRKCTSNI